MALIHKDGHDPFGNLKSVKAGNQTLASYIYGSYNGKIQRITYGNGNYEEYTYDHLDRVKTVKYNGDSSKTQTFVYTSEGNIHSITDTVAGILYLCEYDSLGQLTREYMGSNIPVDTWKVNSVSVGITVNLGFVSTQISNVYSKGSEPECQCSIAICYSPSVGISCGVTYSDAPNPKSMRGGLVFAEKSAPIISSKKLSLSAFYTIGIMDNGYSSRSYGIFVGWCANNDYGYGSSWTFLVR